LNKEITEQSVHFICTTYCGEHNGTVNLAHE